MNTKDIIDAVASRTGMAAATADTAVKAVLELIAEQVVAGQRVSLTGFGAFEARDRAARTGRNPQTGDALQIPAGRVPVFRAARAFREQVTRAAR